MIARRDERDLIIGITPCGHPDGRLVVGVCRGGGLGVLDVGTDADAAWTELDLVVQRWAGDFGVRVPAGAAIDPCDLPGQVTTVLVTDPADVRRFQSDGRRVLVETTTSDEADAAVAAGADGLVLKGAESGGRSGEETAFVLLQRIVRRADLPLWAHGGIGLHTAGAAIAGGARGVVLDAQLALARDCTLPAATRAAIAAMDGSETVVVGGHRLGQDAALASSLAERHRTAGGIVQALRQAVDHHLRVARESLPLGPGAGIAAVHGLRYPVAQGPMTRVSDRAAFATVVAEAGGLPFLALSLMRGEEITDLLDATRRQVGGRPWGVSILGFVPPELREEQLAAVREARPPVALVAGVRPAQIAPLEADGIATFLHVPSPGMLDRCLRDGARRFVFEGRECGGHVGPRSSFTLWEQQIERLLDEDDLSAVEVFFAGGIHDARSAAMVATLAAPLVERGASIGALMGTAYMATAEAVATGAITPTFQQMVLECRDTVLLETSPGHATRCVDSDYVHAFRRRRDELVAAGVEHREMGAELETLNLGRLRTAAKGIVGDGDALHDVDAATQRTDGMFMIGQVAVLHDRPTSVARLHAEVSEGSSRLLAAARESDRTLSPSVVVGGADRSRRLDIAVVGTAGIFPGAGDVTEFWSNVVGGVDAVREVAAVASIGPDQLLSLEVAAAALADAGYTDREFDRERVSVVFGAEFRTDLVAHGLDLGGASYTVDAAGGASLAALAAATKELTSGAADMVLCGGVDLRKGIDRDADGLFLGEGIGCVVLKRLADAEADGDRILALLDAVAASSDRRSLGLTAPRREGQRRALEWAYDDAGVSPATVGLVEADGTATVVGDCAELTTLTAVFSARGAAPGSTALGSVKSQIGHTRRAAGMAGLIKAIHAVHRGVLPPTLHVREPNEAYDPKTSPFVFLDRARPWVAEERRAGVSAFGCGGSNFHAVVSSYTAGDPPDHGVDHWPAELFLLRGAEALDHLVALLDANEAAGRPWPLRDLAATVAARQPGSPVAYAVVADSVDDLRTKIEALRTGARTLPRGCFVAASARGDAGGDDPSSPVVSPQVAFLFPGEGSQREHMAADLFVAFPALRRYLELAGPDLTDRLFPPALGPDAADRVPTLTDTRLAQPALGVVELAIADLLGRCGVRPDLVAGHDDGEIPALALAGALDAEAAPDDVRAVLAGQVSSPVPFRQQIESMYEAGARVFVEAGPGRVLTQLVHRILGDRPHRAVACDVAGEPGIRRFLLALAELAVLPEVPVDTSPLFAGRTAVVDAPASVRPAALFLDGQLIRDRDGQVVAGTLLPATEVPSLHVGTNGQQIVAAERDVVLALLGAPMVGGAVQAANAAPPTVTQLGAVVEVDSTAAPAMATTTQTLERPVTATAGEPAPGRSFPVERPGAGSRPLVRSVPRLVTLPDVAATMPLADVMVGVVDVGTNLVGPLCDSLRAMDAVPLVLDPHEAVLEGLGVLVDLTALRPGDDDPTASVTAQFARLKAAMRAGVPEIVVVTGLGGGLGIDGTNTNTSPDDPTPVVGAAALGMVRTAARELPDVRIRVVDVPPAGDPHLRARQIVDELAGDAPRPEVGYAGGRRRTVEIVPRPLETDGGDHRNDLHLGTHSVVLVTGGARGIGARCAVALARRFGCAFEVIGRTPLPVGDEPADLAGATSEVRRNLVELQRHARTVGYHTVDVRDAVALAELVDELRIRHGRLDGVLHAAGIRDDNRIGDKAAEAFSQVFDTKVRAAELLADAVDFGGFVVFFGSVSGVFGHPGQVDHAAATSVLDVVAHARRGVSRERRLLSVDWGPWSADGIDPDAGVTALVDELRFGAPDPQVVLMAAAPEPEP